jgi:antitoxin (DNA-binding transcriptional repressor) of toxin-antitoxin stability system
MQVSITEAAASLSDLVKAAIDGEEVIILLNGTQQNSSAVKLMPIESVKPRPQFGSAKGLSGCQMILMLPWKNLMSTWNEAIT